MEKSVFGYIWRYSKRQQLIVLLITVASFPFLYLSLEVPKIIINEAIGGKQLPHQLLGVPVEQVSYLMALCAALLLLVLANGFFKMRINIYKGVIAERMMRRLRYQLVDRILRFPRQHFRRVSSGELIPMITSEVEPLGGLMGDAVAHPVFQGGQMLTVIVFLFVQNPVLGMAAIALIPVQAYVIPKLQRQVNLLNKERVKHVRKLAERVGETVAGVHEIHLSDTSAYTRAEFSARLADLFKIRFEIYRKKFFMKFVNNLMNQITPLFFYSIGGYLVITNRLSLGALVAALGAYKELTSPWRELLNYYNQAQDARIRYETLIEQFEPSGLMAPELQATRLESGPSLDQRIALANVNLDDDGVRTLHNVNLEIEPGSCVAIVGKDDRGREQLAHMLCRTLTPSSGRILIGEQNLAHLPEAVTGSRIAYAGPDSYIFSGTVGDNIHLGLRRNPPSLTDPTAEQAQEIKEATAAGNSPYLFDIDWTDYRAAGFADEHDFQSWWFEVIDALGAEPFLFESGLNAVLDPWRRPGLAQRLLEVRRALGSELAREDLTHLVQRFHPDAYNPYATVAENILFGAPSDERLALGTLAAQPYLQEVLETTRLRPRLRDVGLELTGVLLDMFHDIAPGHPFFEQFSFVDEDLFPQLKAMHVRAAHGVENLGAADRDTLLSLALQLIPGRHRLGLIDARLQVAVVEARRVFREALPATLRDAIVFFDEDRYVPNVPVVTNVLLGRVAAAEAGAEGRVRELVMAQLDAANLRRDVVLLVADVPTGSGGSLLPVTGRERVAMARALAKRPDLIVLNQVLGSFGDAERYRVLRRVRELLADATMIWLDKTVPDETEFDSVFEVTAGRVRSIRVPAPRSAGAPQPAPTELIADTNLLGRLPIFGELSTSQRKLIAFASERQTFAAGDVVFAEGDPTDGVHVVVAGELEALRDDRLLERVGPGQILGEIAVICDIPRMATVRAATESTTLFLSAERLLELVRHDSDTAMALLRSVSERAVKLMNLNLAA